MDTFMLVVSAAVLFTVGCAVVWTVRAVRRVGPYRFAQALGAVVRAVLVACFKLFRPDPDAWRRKHRDRDDVWIDVIEGDENSSQAVSEHSGPGFQLMLMSTWIVEVIIPPVSQGKRDHRIGSFDDGLDPDGIYFSHDQSS